MIEPAVSTAGISELGLSRLVRYALQARLKSGVVNEKSLASGKTVLTSGEEQLLARLRQTDRAVRAHEAAHLAVGADLVRGGATFTYATGPDRKRYAVAGEVAIDTSPGRTPQETIPKAQHIRATALAPVDPSPQDRAVSSAASRMESQARSDLAAEQLDQRKRAEAAPDLYGQNGLVSAMPASTGGGVDQFA